MRKLLRKGITVILAFYFLTGHSAYSQLMSGPPQASGPSIPTAYYLFYVVKGTVDGQHNANGYTEFVQGSPKTVPLVADPAPIGSVFSGWTVTSTPNVGYALVSNLASASTAVILKPQPQSIAYQVSIAAKYAKDPKYVPLTLQSISPASANRAVRTTATITGTGFVAGDRVTIGSLNISNPTVVNPTQINVTIPAKSVSVPLTPAQLAPVNVVVTGPDGATSTLKAAFSYTN